MSQFIPEQQLEQQESPATTTDNEKTHPFVCNICKRHYSRVDHLARHYRSHTREKPFSCSTCGKNFARADLLKRHALAHGSSKRDEKKIPTPNQTSRVAQACTACAASKLRCGHEKPCRRCLHKGIPCTFPTSNGRSQNGGQKQGQAASKPEIEDSPMPEIQDSSMPPPDGQNRLYEYADVTQSQMQMQTTGTFPQHTRSMSGAHTIPEMSDPTMAMASMNNDPMLDMDDSSLAEFLREIIMPASPNSLVDPNQLEFMPQAHASRDVFNFGMDSGWEFNELDFSWIDSLGGRDPMLNTSWFTDQVDPPLDQGQQTPDLRNSISLGAEAFQKSLWNWAPTQRDHGWAEYGNLSLPRKDMESVESRYSADTLGYRLDQSVRDAILAMLIGSCDPANIPRVITSFPPAPLLDSLMHLFLRSEVTRVDSWLHLPTFRPQSNRPELNSIVVAHGAVLSSVPTVRKLGFAIYEAVRLEIPKIFETDNSRTRQLQPLQTYALDLSIGLWSGNKRKMELAESHEQPLITMLRRAGRYRRAGKPPAAPEPGDDDKTLDLKWRAWVEAESFKRLAFHTLIHDAQASMSLLVPPLISYSEVSLELPCAPSLWRAKNAFAWRDAYLEQNPSPSMRLPSLVNCVHDIQPLVKVQNSIDVQYSSLIILHAIWGLIAEYRQLEFVIRLQSSERHGNAGLISTSWYQELCQLLDHFRITVSECPGGMRPEQKMIQELFMMNLHVSFEELQLFAGKEGSEEAQRVYPLLKQWFENRKSRQAVWHAGQVVRAAMASTPNHLRDFYAVALYHASLAFWVYGMVSLGSSRSRQRRGSNMTIMQDTEYVVLNGDDTPDVRRFIALGRGIPVIQELPRTAGDQNVGFAGLDNPKAVMEMVINIFNRNCNGALPPLVENLGQLVRDLGNAAWIVSCR